MACPAYSSKLKLLVCVFLIVCSYKLITNKKFRLHEFYLLSFSPLNVYVPPLPCPLSTCSVFQCAIFADFCKDFIYLQDWNELVQPIYLFKYRTLNKRFSCSVRSGALHYNNLTIMNNANRAKSNTTMWRNSHGLIPFTCDSWILVLLLPWCIASNVVQFSAQTINWLNQVLLLAWI